MRPIRVVLGLMLACAPACSLALDFGGSPSGSPDGTPSGDAAATIVDARPVLLNPDSPPAPPPIDARPPCLPPDIADPATGACFVVQPELRSFDDAEASCVARGGHLASIRDGRENDLVVSALDPVGVTWIGLTDAASEGAFVWLDGAASTYTNWNDLEPNNVNGGENCASIYGNGFGAASGRWNDAICADGHPSVCRR